MGCHAPWLDMDGYDGLQTKGRESQAQTRNLKVCQMDMKDSRLRVLPNVHGMGISVTAGELGGAKSAAQ